MSEGPLMRVPKDRLIRAKEYRQRVKQEQGIILPLWRCLVDIEQPPRKKKDNSILGGGFRF